MILAMGLQLMRFIDEEYRHLLRRRIFGLFIALRFVWLIGLRDIDSNESFVNIRGECTTGRGDTQEPVRSTIHEKRSRTRFAGADTSGNKRD